MDILTLAYQETIEWISSIGRRDYVFLYRLFMLYVCALIATSFSFRQLEIRTETLQWSITLVAALASFNVPICHPAREVSIAYTVVVGSLVLLGAAGMLPVFVVESRIKQRRIRRLSYSTLLVLVLIHLVVRRHL